MAANSLLRHNCLVKYDCSSGATRVEFGNLASASQLVSIRTVRLGYTIQFAPVLHAEIVVLLVTEAIEPIPPAKMKKFL